MVTVPVVQLQAKVKGGIMDAYERLRAATTALSNEQLCDCVESLVLGLFGSEDADGEMVLSADHDWSDDIVDGVMQMLADYGLHPDDLNTVEATSDCHPSSMEGR
jgi:hypothetical protein